MTLLRLLWRSLLAHGRGNIPLACGAAIASAVIAGALVLGDSVKLTLRTDAANRLGRVQSAMSAPARTVSAELASRMSERLGEPVAAVLWAGGVASGGRDASLPVSVLGVDETFWRLSPGGPPARWDQQGAALSAGLASRLGIKTGDWVVLRLPKPSLTPGANPFGQQGQSVMLRLPVVAVVEARQMGDFGLRAQSSRPLNAFVPRELLAQAMGTPGRCNMLLTSVADSAAGQAAMQAQMTLADLQLELAGVENQSGVLELRSDRVFLEDAVVQAAIEAGPAPAVGILAYMVNDISAGDRSTPYSMIAAIGMLSDGGAHGQETDTQPDARITPLVRLARRLDSLEAPSDAVAAGAAPVLLGDWLAEDLAISAGAMTIDYYVLEGSRLARRSAPLAAVGVLGPQGLSALDAAMMPHYAGLSDVEDCRRWQSDRIDTSRIRPADEQYWNQRRGTPKAVVGLSAGQRLWANNHGRLTAIRWSGLDDDDRSLIERGLLSRLRPAELGLSMSPAADLARRAADEAMDLGQLFVAMSAFLLASAMVLGGLMTALWADARSDQVGTLLALGLDRWRVRVLLGGELGLVAAAGSAVGAAVGPLYARAMLALLNNPWSGAVAGLDVRFGAELSSLAAALLIGLGVTLASAWIVLARQLRRTPVELLRRLPSQDAAASRRAGRYNALAAGVLLGMAGLAVAWASLRPAQAVTGFFVAGAAALLAGVAGGRWVLGRLSRRTSAAGPTLGELALRNVARRSGRSLSAGALLACGVFVVVAVGLNRPSGDTASATGGFAYWAQLPAPMHRDLNDPADRARLGLAGDWQARVVAMNLRDGDDASCLNLNRPQTPPVLGVDTADMARSDFRFAAREAPTGDGDAWHLLDATPVDGAIPFVADQATATWALQMNLGDELTVSDEAGRPVRLRLVGTLAESVLQGSVIISRGNFERLWPGQAGWRTLLVAAPARHAQQTGQQLLAALGDLGLELSTTHQRLADFRAVTGAYLAMFQALGAIGVALGAGGLGAIVLRNVWERRCELALLRALGQSARAVRNMVLLEHAGILLGGLAWGAGDGVIAVWPAVSRSAGTLPWASLGATLGAIAVVGLASTALAARWATRWTLVDSLRQE